MWKHSWSYDFDEWERLSPYQNISFIFLLPSSNMLLCSPDPGTGRRKGAMADSSLSRIVKKYQGIDQPIRICVRMEAHLQHVAIPPE